MEQILIGIDRDGTLLKDEGKYPGSKDHPIDTFELLPGVADGIKLLRQIPGDVKIVMVTNQSGPACYKMDVRTVEQSNARVHELLKAQGASLDGIYYCPHVTHDYAAACAKENKPIDASYVSDCRDRKPMTGMIEKAVYDFWKKPAEPAYCKIYVIGDRVDADIEMARRAKGVGIFVPSDVKDHSSMTMAHEFKKQHKDSIYIAKNFLDGANWILQRETKHVHAVSKTA
jgi:histidinol-phosphate phosphatase family protein